MLSAGWLFWAAVLAAAAGLAAILRCFGRVAFVRCAVRWASPSKAAMNGARATTIQLARSMGLEAEQHVCIADDGQRLSLVSVSLPGADSSRSDEPRSGPSAAVPGARGESGNAGVQADPSLRPVDGAPRAAAAPPVLVIHGFMQNSETMVCSGHESIVWHLVSRGAEVWLLDCRGSRYSPPRARPGAAAGRWAFGYDDIALLDVPAALRHITEASGAPRVGMVGFSQGAAAALVAAAHVPAASARTACVVALAPPLRPLPLRCAGPSSVLVSDPRWVTALLGRGRALPWLPALQAAAPAWLWGRAAEDSMTRLFGWSMRRWPADPVRRSALHRHIAGSAGGPGVAHWFQTMAAGGLVQRDDDDDDAGGGGGGGGAASDSVPLRLGVRSCRPPVLAVFGADDTLVDADASARALPPSAGVVVVPGFEHLDMLWAETAPADVFAPALRFLSCHVEGLSITDDAGAAAMTSSGGGQCDAKAGAKAAAAPPAPRAHNARAAAAEAGDPSRPGSPRASDAGGGRAAPPADDGGDATPRPAPQPPATLAVNVDDDDDATPAAPPSPVVRDASPSPAQLDAAVARRRAASGGGLPDGFAGGGLLCAPEGRAAARGSPAPPRRPTAPGPHPRSPGSSGGRSVGSYVDAAVAGSRFGSGNTGWSGPVTAMLVSASRAGRANPARTPAGTPAGSPGHSPLGPNRRDSAVALGDAAWGVDGHGHGSAFPPGPDGGGPAGTPARIVLRQRRGQGWHHAESSAVKTPRRTPARRSSAGAVRGMDTPGLLEGLGLGGL